MHFWINKPTGRYYGFTGRRYPASPLPKTRSNQRRYNADVRQMVTPLHRFQTLSAPGSMAGRSNVNNCRVVRTTIRANNETQNSFPVSSTHHTQLNNTSNNVTTAGNNQLISNATSNGTNRSLLDFSELSDTQLENYRVRCGCWIIFMIAAGFVAGIRFYDLDQAESIGIFVIWALLMLLFIACSASWRRRQRNMHQEHHIPEERIASVTTTNTMPNENIRPVSIVRQNPPPPYHIAILIPAPNSSDEAPPPSYDKVMR